MPFACQASDAPKNKGTRKRASPCFFSDHLAFFNHPKDGRVKMKDDF
jgi:hypothetical protein